MKEKNTTTQESKQPIPEGFFVVGIGASAGGLEALTDFLSHLSIKDAPCAVLIAQHLSPTYKSRLVDLLARDCKLVVVEAENQQELEEGFVYVTPPDKDLRIFNGHIVLEKPTNTIGPKPSINVFFSSLAKAYGSRATGIIFSGTGSDGKEGIEEIKKVGGRVLVQEPKTAKYDGMPRAAISTGMADIIMSPSEMGSRFGDILLTKIDPSMEEEKKVDADSLNLILNKLARRKGIDFSNYKSATIGRRLDSRLRLLNLPDLKAYLHHLDDEPGEWDNLFNSIMIGVTSFFRDEEAFEELEKYLQQLVESKKEGDSIRIWCPGCATGEEVYTIAIILRKLFGERLDNFDVQIFGTDINEAAICKARKGIYASSSLEKLPEELLNTYFLKKEGEYELVKSIRSLVLFSKHDLTSNPPFLKLDLISCRNLLIYFGSSLQKQVIPLFHYSLNPNGYLFLGKSETIGKFSDLFSTLSNRNNIYQRKRNSSIRSFSFVHYKPQKSRKISMKPREANNYSLTDMLKETFYHTFEHPYAVLNQSHDILHTHGELYPFLKMPRGSMTASVLKCIHADLQMELRSLINKAAKEQGENKGNIRKITEGENSIHVKLHLKSLMYNDVDEDLTVLIFERIEKESGAVHLGETDDNQSENARILELEHELAATREHLHAFVEELESSNEELQTLNEELQSANEELQSSNEELETINEELQSTNEEIQIAYGELKSTNERLNEQEEQLLQTESNLNALLNNTFQGFVLLNPSYNIVASNKKADELFLALGDKPLRQQSNILDYFPEEDTSKVHKYLKQTLSGEHSNHEWEISSTDQRRHYRISLFPVLDDIQQLRGISMGILDITQRQKTLLELSKQKNLTTSIFDAITKGICVTDSEGKLVQVNEGYCQIYGYSKDELIGEHFTKLVLPEHKELRTSLHDEFIEKGEEKVVEWQVLHKDGYPIDIFMTARLIVNPDGSRFRVTTVRDITESKRNARELKKLSLVASKTHNGVFILDEKNQIEWINKGFSRILDKNLDEITEKELASVFFSSDQQGDLIKEFQAQLKTNQPFQIEFQYLPAEESPMWVQLDLSPVLGEEARLNHYVGILSDISEKVQSNQQIKKTLNHMDAILQTSEDPIWFLNDKLELLYFNKAFEEMMDKDASIHPKKGDKLLYPQLSEGVRALWEEFYGKSMRGKRFNAHISWEFGPSRTREYEFRFNPLINEKQETVAITVFGRDITEAQKDKRRLKSSEEKFRLLSENAPLGIFMADINGSFTYLNERLADIVGLGKEKFRRKGFQSICHPDHEEYFQDGWLESTCRGKKGYFEFKIRRPDQEVRCLRMRIAPISGVEQSPGGYVGNVEDITDTKKAQNEVIRMFEAIPDGICIGKFGQGMVKANPVLLDWFGWNENEIHLLKSEDLSGVIYEEDKPALFERYEEIVMKGKPLLNYQTRLNKREGGYRWISLNIIPDLEASLFFAICKDISQQKKEEEYLRLLESAIVNANDAVLITEADPIEEPGPKIVYVNQAFTQMTGYSREEVIGKTPRILQGPDSDRKELDKLKASLKRWEPHEIELKNYTKDGTPFWVNFSLYPVADDKGHFTHWVSIQRDVSERRKIQSMIESSEANLSALINNTQDLIMSVSLEGELLTVNKAYVEILKSRYGIEPEVGDKILDLLPEDRRTYWEERFQRAFAGESFSEIQQDDFHDSERFFSVSINPIRKGKEVLGCTVFSRDITLRQQDKEALFATNQLLENFMINAPVAMYAKNKEGTFTAVNPSMANYLKTTETSLLGKGLKDILPEEAADLFIEREEEVVKNGQAIIFSDSDAVTENTRHQQYVAFPLYNLQSEVIGRAGIIIDITDLRETQQRLEELNERFALAIRAADLGIWEYHLESGHLIWNEGMFELFDRDPESFTGTYEDWRSAVHPEDLKAAEAKIAKSMESGDNFDTVFRVVWGDGSIRYLVGSAIVKQDEEGNPLRLVGINFDITEERKAQEEIKKAKNIAEEMTRLKSNFLANMSHEIRTPLNGILGLLPMLKIEDDPESLDEILEMMEKSGKRLLSTLIGILDLARIEAEQTDYTLIEIDLGRLIREVFFALESMAHSKGLTYEFIAEEREYTVLADERMLTQIFSNMIGNALKFTDQGRVEVKIGKSKKDGRDFIRIDIVDTGVGISDENQETIFMPFKQESEGMRRKYEGSGLGLSIVKRYTEMLEGSVEVKSQKGEGSTFTVYLPEYKAENF